MKNAIDSIFYDLKHELITENQAHQQIMNLFANSFVINNKLKNMETLKIEKSTAKKLYHESPKWFQAVLYDTFGKSIRGEILDRINSIEDALNEADEPTRQDYLKAIGGYTTPDRIAEEELKLIIKVVNEGVVFDYSDSDQKKWFPVFKFSPGSGFVFSSSGFSWGSTAAISGSRLCFSSEKKCETIAKRFIEKYNMIL